MKRRFVTSLVIAVAATTMTTLVFGNPASAGQPGVTGTELRATLGNGIVPLSQAQANKGANSPKVGLYQCPSGPLSQVTFLSILPGGKFLGPYTTKSSKPSRFRTTGGAMYPGGRILTMLDGPYRKLQDVRYEYYPAGSTPFTTRYDVPYIHIVSLPPYFVGACYWTQKNPYLS